MTQEEMVRALRALQINGNVTIQINGNISQLCAGDGQMTLSNEQQPEPAQPASAHSAGNGDSYFDSQSFANSIQRLARHMEQFKSIHWNHVYLFLHRKMGLEEMTAAGFGKFVQAHGGPNAQKVRKDGNYQLSSGELLRQKPIIESVSAFFSVD
ncbi:MAG: hypothetical protein LKE41_02685 [Prevotella sp.]|jgi:hypothetical protein|nr:hypothetical protein [Prevotella sp.]MCI2103240.1 hypothetical protein [Prevotella sp.]